MGAPVCVRGMNGKPPSMTSLASLQYAPVLQGHFKTAMITFLGIFGFGLGTGYSKKLEVFKFSKYTPVKIGRPLTTLSGKRRDSLFKLC